MKLDNFKLFAIDVQNDFITGSLAVPGAVQDVQNIAQLVDRLGDSINSIFLTADTHPVIHIGHPGYWKDANGQAPAPFTRITREDLASGAFTTADPDKSKYALDYVTALGGTTVWPVHCVNGTVGFAPGLGLVAAILKWRLATSRVLAYAAKGEDPDLEYFGVFAPEYNSKEHFNETLARQLLNSDLPIVVVGEARSHCVRRSVEQLVQYIREQGIKFDLNKIVLLEDCMSDVVGFEETGRAFFTSMTELGVTITKSTELV